MAAPFVTALVVSTLEITTLRDMPVRLGIGPDVPASGACVNVNGMTSFLYAGLSWTVDIGPAFFVEASLGGTVHNGNTQSNLALVPRDRNALGCSPLFRESASVGYRFTPNWSIMATVEHLSNAGICAQNRGLTNVGVRLGYTF